MKMEWKMAGFQGSRSFQLWRFAALVLAVFFAASAGEARAASVKVVIDPGHGGTNLGAQYKGLTEKDMNLVVAQAMAEELRSYDGVEVFLTRTFDQDLTLQQRADYAKEVDADFLFCLHFNMSEQHTLYGTEVWISAFDKYYARGKGFGELCLDELCSLGLYRRGVKTRLYTDGTDYYGIIKHAKEYGIPAAIIEHCHLDHAQDAGRYETAEALQKLGKLDATAVAKYYGLYSPSLGKDYRKYGKSKVEVPSVVMKPDDTAPVNVGLTCLRTKAATGEVNILLAGEDPESGILYYDYSLDGGKTYSGLQKWETGEKALECTIDVPVDQDVALKCRVYNGYDLEAETETVEIAALQGWPKETTEAEEAAGAASPGENAALQNILGRAEEAEEARFEGEAAETSGGIHKIDMGWYEKRDAEKERQGIDGAALSKFLWLAILGLLLSLLLFLLAARAANQKKKRKARRRGRRR